LGRRVYFSPCGIGLGHAGRCISVARSLEKKGFDVMFSTYSDAIPLVNHEGFKLAVAPPFGYWTWPDGTVDPWRTMKWMSGKLMAAFVRQTKFEVEQIAFFNPDVILSDSRLSTVIGGKMTGRPVLTILNQFHLIAPGFIHYPTLTTMSDIFSYAVLSPLWGSSDELIIPDYPPPFVISRNNLRVPRVFERKVRYVGPILPVRPNELPIQEKLKQKLAFDSRPIIYASVSGPKDEKRWLSEKLLRFLSGFPDKYQVAISLGRRGENSRPVKKGNMTIYNWIPERFEFLKACDLVISRGSHVTVTEALAFGKPMLLIPAQEQIEQVGNAKTADDLGVAKTANPRRMSRSVLLSKVDDILTSESYRRRAEEFMKVASQMDAIESITRLVMEYTGEKV